MSGGSYNYLCFKDGSDLLAGQNAQELESMFKRLIELEAYDAAALTHDLMLTMREARVRVDSYVRRLSDLWREVEWADSGDTSKEDLPKRIEAWRASPLKEKR